MTPNSNLAKRYRRPLVLAIGGSVIAELVIFVVWGLILYPDGHILKKFLWAVVFCGVGMGSTVGALINLFVIDRLHGRVAIVATTLIAVGVLGGLCNGLCYVLDTHYFHYFGGAGSPVLFVANGVVMSAVGGALVGWLLFTPRGHRLLDALRL